MARKHTEQLALRPPAGTKDRLLALQQEGETLLAVVLRAVDALERENRTLQPGERLPRHPLPPEARQARQDLRDLESSLDFWLDAIAGTLGAALNRLDRLEARYEPSRFEPQEKPAAAHPSGSMTEYVKNHPDMVEDVNTGEHPAPLMERTPDTQRCECRTARGGRCRSKTTDIIKARVRDQIAEFGSCKRHVQNFEPFSVYW